jgi:hypothetical protein
LDKRPGGKVLRTSAAVAGRERVRRTVLVLRRIWCPVFQALVETLADASDRKPLLVLVRVGSVER